MNKDQKKALLIALFSEMLFGASFVFIKMVNDSVSVMELLSWRNIFALCFMTMLICAGVLKVDYRGKNIGPLLFLSFFQPVTYYIFETIGVRMTTASESGMILACCPIITMIFARLFLKDNPFGKQWFFMLVAVLGGVLAASVGGVKASKSMWGYLFLFIAMCCEAAYAISSQAIKNFNSAEKTYIMTIAGTTVFTVCALVENFLSGDVCDYLLLPVNDTSFLAAVLFLSLGCNVVGFLSGNYALPIIGATKRGACGGFGTVVAILGGVFFLDESIALLQIIAAVLILSGAYGVLFFKESK